MIQQKRSDEEHILTEEVFKRLSRKLLKHFDDVEYCLDDAIASIKELKDRVNILEQENQDLKGQLEQWGIGTSKLSEMRQKDDSTTFRGLFLK